MDQYSNLQVCLSFSHPDSKAKVLYKLTKKGIDLLPLLIEIHLWAEKYSSIPEDIKAILSKVKKNKAGGFGGLNHLLMGLINSSSFSFITVTVLARVCKIFGEAVVR